MKRRTALAIVLALIVFVGVWVFVYFVEMSNTTRAVVWLVACVVILASQWIGVQAVIPRHAAVRVDLRGRGPLGTPPPYGPALCAVNPRWEAVA